MVAHTTKAQKANMTAERTQTALENDEADMLAKNGAEGDGAFFEGRVARDALETREMCMRRLSMQLVIMRRLKILRVWKIQEEAKATHMCQVWHRLSRSQIGE